MVSFNLIKVCNQWKFSFGAQSKKMVQHLSCHNIKSRYREIAFMQKCQFLCACVNAEKCSTSGKIRVNVMFVWLVFHLRCQTPKFIILYRLRPFLSNQQNLINSTHSIFVLFFTAGISNTAKYKLNSLIYIPFFYNTKMPINFNICTNSRKHAEEVTN